VFVVTGATGNIGRPLTEALARAGEDVVAVARHPAELPPGVRFQAADLANPATVQPVLNGAEAVFLLLSGPALGSRQGLDGIVDAIKGAGVPHVVLLSAQAARTRPEAAAYTAVRMLEDAVQWSGTGWTILRPGGFDSNALAWAGSVRSQRTVRAPFGDVGLPLIDPADIADTAAAIMVSRSHVGRTYELTGPAPVSPRQQAAVLSQMLGEPVHFLEQSPAEARAQRIQVMPESMADTTLAIFGMPTNRERQISPAVEAILGRPPRTFTDWASRHVAAFR
jgi:uncharacterized protein YbjT (DUF2867 family)